jgi:hypothetical protein
MRVPFSRMSIGRFAVEPLACRKARVAVPARCAETVHST